MSTTTIPKIFAAVAAALVLAAPASATQGWTSAQAATRLKATYTTIDQKNYDWTKALLDKVLARGIPETDPQVIALRHRLVASQHQAKVTTASCKGIGKATGRLYSHFYCTVAVQSEVRLPPDYMLYATSKKLTVRLPFRIQNGWN